MDTPAFIVIVIHILKVWSINLSMYQHLLVAHLILLG